MKRLIAFCLLFGMSLLSISPHNTYAAERVGAPAGIPVTETVTYAVHETPKRTISAYRLIGYQYYSGTLALVKVKNYGASYVLAEYSGTLYPSGNNQFNSVTKP